mmetsp:Transcript_119121/g.282629  ORF Transcript_119121/g.282629 Transcript_119121/m.282629 type:complete len:292 (-) Transcript_119121:869-1744(-)
MSQRDDGPSKSRPVNNLLTEQNVAAQRKVAANHDKHHQVVKEEVRHVHDGLQDNCCTRLSSEAAVKAQAQADSVPGCHKAQPQAEVQDAVQGAQEIRALAAEGAILQDALHLPGGWRLENRPAGHGPKLRNHGGEVLSFHHKCDGHENDHQSHADRYDVQPSPNIPEVETPQAPLVLGMALLREGQNLHCKKDRKAQVHENVGPMANDLRSHRDNVYAILDQTFPVYLNAQPHPRIDASLQVYKEGIHVHTLREPIDPKVLDQAVDARLHFCNWTACVEPGLELPRGTLGA